METWTRPARLHVNGSAMIALHPKIEKGATENNITTSAMAIVTIFFLVRADDWHAHRTVVGRWDQDRMCVAYFASLKSLTATRVTKAKTNKNASLTLVVLGMRFLKMLIDSFMQTTHLAIKESQSMNIQGESGLHGVACAGHGPRLQGRPPTIRVLQHVAPIPLCQ